MRFLVVVPSIRQSYPGFNEAMVRIEASFTQPTEFHVLEGSSGKAQTLNRALAEMLPNSEADVYVTMDDDFVPTAGWQDKMSQAFEAHPEIGSLGIWLGDDPEMLAYMGADRIHSPRQEGELTLRTVKPGHHIVGCNVAMRRDLAMAIGPTPESSERYQFWEDGWRGRMVSKHRYEQAFVDAGPVEFLRWQDTKEYLEMREHDIESAKSKVAGIMKASGVGPSLSTRLFAKIRRTFRGN